MRQHVTIWTLKRGAVDPPEPLDYDNQACLDALEIWEQTVQEERDYPLSHREQMRLARGAVQYERDPVLSRRERTA
jgi:hypothetical protein